MFFESGLKFRYIDDWDTVLHSAYHLPIEFDGYTKRVSEMKMVREMIEILSEGNFEEVKRSESRKKQMRKLADSERMYYNLVFSNKGSKTGYGSLIQLSQPTRSLSEKSRGIILIARLIQRKGESQLEFEKAKFDNFLVEVRPYIEMLGELYRRTRSM